MFPCLHSINKMRAFWVSALTLSPTVGEKFGFLFICCHQQNKAIRVYVHALFQQYESNCLHWYTFFCCTLLSSNQEDCVSVLTKYQQNEDSLSFCSHLLNNSVREVWVSFPTLSSTKWEQSGFMFICYHQHYESSCLHFYTISEKMRAAVSIRTLSSPNEEDLCFWAYVVSTKWKQWLLLLQILRKQKYSTDATSVFKVKLKTEWYNTR